MLLKLSGGERAVMDRLRRIFDENQSVLRLFSTYLNEAPQLVTAELVDSLCADCGVGKEFAFASILAAAAGLEPDSNADDRIFQRKYLLPAIHQLDTSRYTENPYYKKIRIPDRIIGNWELKTETYPPYRGFVCNDPLIRPDLTDIPQIGFFDRPFSFPAILENGNEWMTLTPVDLDTCDDAIASARGRVVTFGMGLGYFAYMASRKQEVSQVTVVDISPEVISLFETCILPQFSHPEKVNIVCADAFAYAEKVLPGEQFDYAFVDTWRDVSDGFPMYVKMKRLEKLSPQTKFDYWIEGSILSHLRTLVFEQLWEQHTSGEKRAPLPGEPVIDSADALYRLLSDDGLREIAGDIVRM